MATAPTKPRRSTAKLGSASEQLVEHRTPDIVAVVKFPNGWKITGPKRGFPVKTPCDFGGTVIRTGRAIWFDVKRSERVNACPIGDDTFVHPHQRGFLIAQGAAGAVAGLLVEHVRGDRLLWLDWNAVGIYALRQQASLRWDDPAWVVVGPSSRPLDFRKVPGVAGEAVANV